MGSLLLPGFLGGRPPVGPVAVGLGLGNLAAALRVLPPLVAGLLPEAPFIPWLLPPPALAGLAGAGLPVCLALIVAHATGRRQGQAPPRALRRA